MFLAATAAAFPDPNERGPAQYLVVITLGYGHLIGAAVFARDRMAGLVPAGVPTWLWIAFSTTTVATAFACYASVLGKFPEVLVPLLAISLWHIVENDLAVARTCRGRLPLGAPSRRRRDRAVVLVGTLSLIAVGTALLTDEEYALAFHGKISAALRAVFAVDLTGMSWFGFGDFFAAVTLYHLVGFLVLFADRAADRRRHGLPTARLWRTLLWVHALPAAVCVALLATPDRGADPLRSAIFSPGIYLFWSMLHVVQTAITRRAPTLVPPGLATDP